ncbi:hypothetical protein DSECCO2_233260 [anaerobic digester metagenome]
MGVSSRWVGLLVEPGFIVARAFVQSPDSWLHHPKPAGVLGVISKKREGETGQYYLGTELQRSLRYHRTNARDCEPAPAFGVVVGRVTEPQRALEPHSYREKPSSPR